MESIGFRHHTPKEQDILHNDGKIKFLFLIKYQVMKIPSGCGIQFLQEQQNDGNRVGYPVKEKRCILRENGVHLFLITFFGTYSNKITL